MGDDVDQYFPVDGRVDTPQFGAYSGGTHADVQPADGLGGIPVGSGGGITLPDGQTALDVRTVAEENLYLDKGCGMVTVVVCILGGHDVARLCTFGRL